MSKYRPQKSALIVRVITGVATGEEHIGLRRKLFSIRGSVCKIVESCLRRTCFQFSSAIFSSPKNKTPVKPTCCQGLTGVSVKRCDPLDSSAYWHNIHIGLRIHSRSPTPAGLLSSLNRYARIKTYTFGCFSFILRVEVYALSAKLRIRNIL